MGIASLHPSYERTTASSSGMTSRISSANLAAKARNKARTRAKCPGRTSVHKGRVVFGAMDEVVFGRPASEAIVEQMDRLGASRAFLMVSGTLNRETDEIENIRRALGAALRRHLRRDAAAYAARGGDRRRRTGPRRQGRSHRHDRRRLDHRRRQGGAALPRQRYPRPSKTSTGSGPVSGAPPPMTAPTVRQISVPTTIAGGEFSRQRRRHQRDDQGQGDACAIRW